MEDDSIVFLTCSRKESRNIHQTDNRNVEGIAEAHEACTLAAGVNIEHTGVGCWLIGNDTHALTIEAGKTGDNVLCKLRLHLKEVTIVGDGLDDLIHVVSLVRIIWKNVVEQILFAVDRIGALHTRSLLGVVGGDIAQQGTNLLHCIFLCLGCETGHTTLSGMYARTT